MTDLGRDLGALFSFFVPLGDLRLDFENLVGLISKGIIFFNDCLGTLCHAPALNMEGSPSFGLNALSMLSRLVFVLGLMLVGVGWAQPVMTPVETFYQAVFEGEVAMRSGRARQAVVPFQRALEIAQTHGLMAQVREAKIRLAKSNLYARNHREAARLFEELLPEAKGRDVATFHLGAGQAWKALGDGKKAGLHFLAALKEPLAAERRQEITDLALLCLDMKVRELERKRRLFDAHGTARTWLFP